MCLHKGDAVKITTEHSEEKGHTLGASLMDMFECEGTRRQHYGGAGDWVETNKVPGTIHGPRGNRAYASYQESLGSELDT